MSVSIKHSNNIISGVINLTASKSISNRALIIKALSLTDFTIDNLAEAKDTKIISALINDFNNGIRKFDVGHAGTVMRFFTAFLASKNVDAEITGSSRMQERPIKVLVDALNSLGAEISYLKNAGYPPIKISPSVLSKNSVDIDGSVSSQYISALMLIAPSLPNGLEINFTSELVSKPYLNMTSEIMKYFGAGIKWQKDSKVEIESGQYKAKDFFVEADWSSASYWYGIAALSDEFSVKLKGLSKDSLQGDAEVARIYESFGVETEFENEGVAISKRKDKEVVKEFIFDFETCPDIAQTVAVTCAGLNVKAKFTGLQTLRIKETDRIKALEDELNQLGFKVEVDGDDLMILNTERPIKFEQSVKTYDDHRMALAFAPLSLVSTITIEDEDVIVKSYPNYWNDLKEVGFLFD